MGPIQVPPTAANNSIVGGTGSLTFDFLILQAIGILAILIVSIICPRRVSVACLESHLN